MELMLMPSLLSQKTLVSIAEKIMLNSVRARAQPFLTSLETEKVW